MTSIRPSVETLRKPSTGLKPEYRLFGVAEAFGRDTQKTQHGIETVGICVVKKDGDDVETLRKPSTGLKQRLWLRLFGVFGGRDTQKTQHGIETKPSARTPAL